MAASTRETAAPQLAPPIAVLVDADGIRSLATPGDVRGGIGADRLYWLDIFGGDESARTDCLNQLGLDARDLSWAQRFGQTGRVLAGERTLRVVTWLVGRTGDLVEVHLLASPHWIVTLWTGEGGALAEVRQRFSARLSGPGQSHYQAAGILLQLLLSTVDLAIAEADAALDALQAQVSQDARALDHLALVTWHDTCQSRWARFDRYSSSVRSAVVGVEAVPGMDVYGAAELHDYAGQVDDVVHRLQERSQWFANILRDSAASTAQHQSDQISRLTVVSVIFLPLTFLTGLFGMNFNWMIAHIGSGPAFLVLGLVLPAVSAGVTLALFLRRGLLFVPRKPVASVHRPRGARPGPPPG